MPNYTVRVELKGNPTYEQYESLHALMATLGLSRNIAGINIQTNVEAWFALPHATYFGAAAGPSIPLLQQIVADVRAKIQPGVAVFVAETTDGSVQT